MTYTKDIIKKIILDDDKNFKRFEMLENFAKYAEDSDDIVFLLTILIEDKSSVVRHEAAAQLLKIEQKKPWLLDGMRDLVIEKLLNVVLNDISVVAKHESAEALSYIGNRDVMLKFDEIIKKSGETDELMETIKLARDTIEYRIIKNISSSELSETILKEAAN